MTVDARTTDGTVCPECGRAFRRPSALGAHRWQAHRIAGTSPQARSRRRAAGEPDRTRASSSAPPATRQARGEGELDRDALLRIVFPNGIPVRDDVIRLVMRWLDEAEMLARLR